MADWHTTDFMHISRETTGCHKTVSMVFGYRLRDLLSPLLNGDNIGYFSDAVSRDAPVVCEEFYDTLETWEPRTDMAFSHVAVVPVRLGYDSPRFEIYPGISKSIVASWHITAISGMILRKRGWTSHSTDGLPRSSGLLSDSKRQQQRFYQWIVVANRLWPIGMRRALNRVPLERGIKGTYDDGSTLPGFDGCGW